MVILGRDAGPAAAASTSKSRRMIGAERSSRPVTFSCGGLNASTEPSVRWKCAARGSTAASMPPMRARKSRWK